ncbi:class I SAM-dependent DNA methyltransferase [Nocardiopsis oceani]
MSEEAKVTREHAPGARPWYERERAQASAYDAIGDRYDEAFPHKEGQIDFTERLLRRLPDRARVLDLGCGTGLPTTGQLASAGHRVTGLDLSPRMVALARANVPEADIVQGDMVDLSPDDAGYDAIVSFFSLLHLPRSGISEMLGTIRRSLAPEGRLCLSMVEADVDDIVIPFLGQPLRVTGYLRDDLHTVLSRAGLTIEEEEVHSYIPATTQAEPEIQIFLICRRDR